MPSLTTSGDSCCLTSGSGSWAKRPNRWGIVTGVVASLPLIGLAALFDAPVERLLYSSSTPAVHEFARLTSQLGEGWVIAVIGVVLSAGLFFFGRLKASQVIFLVTAVSLLTGATATVLRTMIGRTRPNVDFPQGIYGVWHDSHWIAGKSDFASFPSGHAATVVGLAAAIWIFNRKLGLAAAGYAVLVSWGRVAQGAHHFSDIVAASLLALGCAPWFAARLAPPLEFAGWKLQRAWLGRRRDLAPDQAASVNSEAPPKEETPEAVKSGARSEAASLPSGAPSISVVIPCHNEEGNLRPLVAAIGEEAGRIGLPYEIVVTDDFSTDNSWGVLRELAANDRRVRALRLDRNRGQSAALWAGLQAARGRFIVTMDADLQNSPRDLPRFVRALEHADCVCGSRVAARARGDSFLRVASSRVANWTRNRLTRETVTDSGCCYRAFKRECLRNLKFFKGMHRFLPTLFKMEGHTVTEIPVGHNPRTAGKSHYGMWNRLFISTADLLAVRWMQSRNVRFEIAEVVNAAETPVSSDS